MTIIKINAITVPENAGDELARRFAARAGAVDDQDGFEGFELFRPTDGRNQWLVVTRWRDDAAFNAWVSSPALCTVTPELTDLLQTEVLCRSRRSCGPMRWPVVHQPAEMSKGFPVSASNPLSIWSGMDVSSNDPEQLQVIEEFYRERYLSQVSEQHSNLDQGHLYELLTAGQVGSRGSRFLTTFEITDEQAAEGFRQNEDLIAVDSTPSNWRTDVTTSWSVLYRHVAETGPETSVPYAIYLVGVNPPAGLGADQLEVFNDFYTNVHMPEVAARRYCLRATRYELDRELRSPPRRAPRFLAIYELDETASSNKRHIGGPYASGPEVWRRHTTPWRLWYRRL